MTRTIRQPHHRLGAAFVLGLCAVLPAAAQGQLVTFRTPSNNIGCGGETAKNGYVRCDISAHSWPTPRRPTTCEFDYGGGLELQTRGRASFVCAGDTVLNRDRILRYGASIKIGRISCTSRTTGVTCRNPAGHGFSLSKQAYRIF